MKYNSLIENKKIIAYFDDRSWQIFLSNVAPQFHKDQVFHDIFDDTSDLYDVTISLACNDKLLLIEGTHYNVEKSCAQCQESYQYFTFKENNKKSEFFNILYNNTNKLKELGKKFKLYFPKNNNLIL